MKLVIFFVFNLVILSPCYAFKVSIDPGHGGGDDSGAIYAGIKESHLVLKISKKLYTRLRKDPFFDVQLLRQSDESLALEDRVKNTKKFSPDLFLSIHANANPNKRARGTEFYIQNQLPVDEEALFLAHNEFSGDPLEGPKKAGDIESIVYDLEKSHRITKSYQISTYLREHWSSKKRKMIRQGPFFVLSHNDVPSILLEVGYLSHSKERQKLLNPAYQDRMVKKIHKALKDYATNMDKLPPGILKPQNAKTR